MKVASQICDEWISSDIVTHLSDNFTDNSIYSIITEMAPAFEDTLTFCKLFNKNIDCSKIFFPIFTDEGLCFTFNSMYVKDVVTDQ